MDENMKIYEEARKCPQSALRAIQAGRLKGKSDINPMWRIQKLTELFGACGIGWYYDITKQWTEKGCGDEICCFCNINLYIRTGDTWSQPIQGTGGSMLVAKENRGPYTSDECYKMALTDAISVACKALGFAADVYWSDGASKYNRGDNQPQPPEQKQEYKCQQCGKPFEAFTSKGVTYSAGQAYHMCEKKYGKAICKECREKGEK